LAEEQGGAQGGVRGGIGGGVKGRLCSDFVLYIYCLCSR
jgi:hypothetical protein